MGRGVGLAIRPQPYATVPPLPALPLLLLSTHPPRLWPWLQPHPPRLWPWLQPLRSPPSFELPSRRSVRPVVWLLRQLSLPLPIWLWRWQRRAPLQCALRTALGLPVRGRPRRIGWPGRLSTRCLSCRPYWQERSPSFASWP